MNSFEERNGLMNPREYIEAVKKTESPEEGQLNRRILHGILGCTDEVGELAKHAKAVLFYGKPLDPVNIKEELGDLLWYVAITIDAIGSSFEEVMTLNIAKLKRRYGGEGGFDKEKALKRDLDAERDVLNTKQNEEP